MKTKMDLDDVLESVGVSSRYQAVSIVICFSILWVSASLMHAAVLYSAIPDYRCKIKDEEALSNITCNDTTGLKKILEQAKGFPSCQSIEVFHNDSGDVCDLSALNNGSACSQGFVYSDQYYDKTVISEWDLVCDRQILDAVANSLFFFGCLVGSALQGIISDWFGRRVSLIVFSYVMVLSNIGLAFSHQFWLFLIFRIFTGGSQIAIALSCYTYGYEIIDLKSRKIIVPICALLGALCHTVFPAIQFGLSHWRYLTVAYLLMAVPGLIAILILPESPRWLMANGRENEAKKIVERIAQSNGRTLEENIWEGFLKTYNSLMTKEEKEDRSTMVDLFRRPLIAVMSTIVANAWFVINLVHFGLVLNGSNLFGNPIFNTTLNGVVEIVAAIIFFAMQYMKPKNSAFVAYIFTGITCLLSILQSYENTRTVGVVMAIAGKMFSTLAFSVIYYISLDAYPVKVRSVALSLGSMTGRVAGIITPFVLFAQFTAVWVTSTIFGVLSILTAFSFLLLPDGNVKALNPTLDDTERFYFGQMKFCVKLFRIKMPSDDATKGIDNEGMEPEVHWKVSELPLDGSIGTRL